MGARLMVVEGRAERIYDQAGVLIFHLVARKLTDHSDLLDGLGAAGGGEGAWERVLGRPDPGSRQDAAEPGLPMTAGGSLPC